MAGQFYIVKKSIFHRNMWCVCVHMNLYICIIDSFLVDFLILEKIEYAFWNNNVYIFTVRQKLSVLEVNSRSHKNEQISNTQYYYILTSLDSIWLDFLKRLNIIVVEKIACYLFIFPEKLLLMAMFFGLIWLSHVLNLVVTEVDRLMCHKLFCFNYYLLVIFTNHVVSSAMTYHCTVINKGVFGQKKGAQVGLPLSELMKYKKSKNWHLIFHANKTDSLCTENVHSFGSCTRSPLRVNRGANSY